MSRENNLMSEPAIIIDNLTCRFQRKIVAVNMLSLEVPKGKIFGFLGENGAGKTTTIRTLMGLQKPSSGSVKLLGYNPLGGNVPLLQKIGYVSEERSMYRWMTVNEVMGFNAGLYRNWDVEYAESLRMEFELDYKQKVKNLSRGQTAKLALLCALAPKPEILILDEASSGLDPIVRRIILEKLIDTSSSNNTTIFFSSHLVEEVDRISDEIAIICNGQLVIKGEKDNVRDSLKRVILPGYNSLIPKDYDWIISFSKKESELQVIVKDLDNEKLSLLSSQIKEAPQVTSLTLEDVFAEYTGWWKRNMKTAN